MRFSSGFIRYFLLIRMLIYYYELVHSETSAQCLSPFLIIFLHRAEKRINVTMQIFRRVHVLDENEQGRENTE